MRPAALALVAACAALIGADPAALVREVADYDYGKDPAAVRELESLVLRSASGTDPALERLLVAGLASARTLAAKDAFCRDLALLGGVGAVPPLAVLLAAPETAEIARYALERIPGERSAAALRQALGRTSGAVKIGIVNSLGRRRDRASVDALKALLVSPEALLAAAAAEALGRIGNRAASEALLGAPASFANADALLRIAEQPDADRSAIYRRLVSDGRGDAVRAAALEGLARSDPARALPLLRAALESGAARLEGVAARELARLEGVALAKGMTDLPERAQVRILAALTDAGGVKVRPVLLEVASGGTEAVRAVAMSGLAKVGTTADIPLLATRAATAAGEERAAARAALADLRADGTDAAILQLLPGAEPKVKLELIRAMGGRGITSGSEVLLSAAAGTDQTVRVESIRALRETAGTAQMPALVALLVKATAEGERRECERTLAAVIRRSPETPVAGVIEAYRAANAPAVQVSLLNVLSAVGNSTALEVVRQALQDPAADVQRGALNALANWPTPDPLDDLLALARSTGDATRPVLALRGYIKLAQIPSSRTPAATAVLLGTAMTVATRGEEKKSTLAALQRVVCPESLDVARQSLSDPLVAAEAKVAVETLERALAFVKQ